MASDEILTDGSGVDEDGAADGEKESGTQDRLEKMRALRKRMVGSFLVMTPTLALKLIFVNQPSTL